MNWGVLIAVLIYEVVSIVGIGAFMAYKNKKSVRVCSAVSQAVN
mgnify:CR=1 FL=1